jgi:3-phosphoshikimate 1-carboxyvinyltransferase
MERLEVKASDGLDGLTTVPGDKSISHRAVLLGMLANGTTHVRNWLAAGDTEATLASAQRLGAPITRHDETTLEIVGGQLRASAEPLDFVNAGTGIRLAAGIMAGQSFASVLDGSAQLRRRPMKRITDPLRLMGADIRDTDGYAPLHITPTQLKGITYDMPVASAQVKSAVLLAGLYADAPTTVIQPGAARDHTERMLQAMGVTVTTEQNHIIIHPTNELAPLNITVPGDFSSAAFLIVAGLIVPDSAITLTDINLNDTRTGLLDALEMMGAKITVTEKGEQGGEPIGDIHIQTSQLHGAEIGGDLVVRMIDEFPILMVAALCAEGETIVRDARELRVKETDRIAVMAQELRKLGATIEEKADGFRIVGRQKLTGAIVEGHDDHRVAMSLTVAGCIAQGTTQVNDASCTADSFPYFPQAMQKLGASITTPSS